MYMYKTPFFSLSFCELIAHADLVWDFLIINLVVFQSLGTDTVPSLKSWFFFFWHNVLYSIIPGTRWGFVLVFKIQQLRCFMCPDCLLSANNRFM